VDKASFFILNIFLNSFLAFFTVAFLIESVIFLFRIRQGRVAATLRMIPIIKLPLDLFLYDFSRWSYSHGINPLNCEEGTRTLSVMFGWINTHSDWLFLPINSGIQMGIPDDLTFTIADLIGHTIKPIILKVFALLVMSVTVGLVIRKSFLYYYSLTALESLAKNSQPLCKKMRNAILSSCIRKRGVKVLTSPTLTGSPFVAGLISSVVYIPDLLSKNLSRKEYEAVLAHEIEHVRYKDSLVRLTLDFIETIFWWIPTKWLCARIEEGQEVGCDLKCKKYGIDSTDLASAVCKSAKYSINTPNHIFAHQLAKHTILKRVNILLQPPSIRFKKIRFTFTCLAFGIAFLVIFLGRFWMF
jgi:beta-lactamase regulating signal transducer with metallopeptidase domain